ncbi:hypothetical protein WG908_09735 [Sphingobium sp. AN641]|uniref:hypothetical protein n=1 Tax=Sphingobium sp. AN641 TaxID=3133443 RepID=UPI0030C021AE
MDRITEQKLKAAGKVALGAARIVSGVVTATGHGFLGSLLRQHHMIHHAARLGKHSAEGGLNMLKEGVADWQDATR